MRYIFLSIFLFFVQNAEKTLNIPLMVKNFTETNKLGFDLNARINGKEHLLIHYFDGGCAPCIGSMAEFDSTFKQIQNEKNIILLISNSKDTVLVNYYADKAKITSVLLHDINGAFYTLNKELISSYGSTFLIDNRGKVIFSGDPFQDEKTKQKYLDLMK